VARRGIATKRDHRKIGNKGSFKSKNLVTNIYRKEGQAGLKKPRGGKPKKDHNSLEERIKQLEMENTWPSRRRIARRARYKAIYRYRGQFKIKDACAYLGFSTSAYYTWLKRIEEPDPNEERMCLVQEAYERSRKTYGYRRIGIWIERECGLKINHKAVLRLMQKLNIRSIARKRNPYKGINNCYGTFILTPII